MNTQTQETCHEHPTTPYEEMTEPPDVPPICTYPPRPGKTWPKSQQTSQTPHDPGHSHGEHTHPQVAQGEPHPGQTQPDPTHGEHQHGTPATDPAVAVPAIGVPRQNQRNLTPAARAELYRRLRDYVMSDEDPVAYHRANGHVHRTPQFLTWHRQFIARFEQWQRRRLADPSAFIPLAFWEPADPIPSEFPHPRRNASIPAMPPPDGLSVDRLRAIDYAQLSSMVEDYHNRVHDTIGGDMQDLRFAPQDPCFWLFHSYVDNVFAQWEATRAGSQT